MPVVDCTLLMRVAQDMFTHDDDFQSDIERLLETKAEPKAFAEAFASRLPETEAAVVRFEFELLPVWTLTTIAENWLRAHKAGVGFELRNVRPRDVLASARKRRVDLSIAMEEDAVILELAHVPGRHGSWYQDATQAIAS